MTTDQQPSDAELISAVRGGDTTAYGELFSRHVEAARRLARQLASAGDVEDLVAEAFAKVLTIVQRGGGPDLAFRAYLLTAVRSLHIDGVRGAIRLRPVDDLAPFDNGVPFRDTAVEGFENQAAARAFATLPERWQLVLWHTEVEGQKPAEVAQLLGMSANSVSALAYRAREGLRQAFLNMHAQDAEDDACAWTQDNLGAYIRNAASKRDSTKVRTHVDECRRCMGIYLELSEVNTNLSGILGPLVLGSAAAGYIAAAVGTAGQGGLVGLLGRAGDIVSNHTSSVAMVGVAATIVLITGLFIGLRGQPSEAPVASDAPVLTTPALPAPPTQTFGSDAPTLGLAETPNPPKTKGPGSRSPDDPETSSASPSSTPGVPSPSATPDAPGTPNEPPGEPEGEIGVPTTKDPQPLPPARVDASMRIDKKTGPPTVKNVRFAVSGLPAGGGVLHISTSNNQSVRVEGACEGTGPARSCTIPANTEWLNVAIVSEDVEQLTIVFFRVEPVGAKDTDLTNNHAEVELEPAK
jgi:RNA polymerase sigma factor (sigma-70 family)